MATCYHCGDSAKTIDKIDYDGKLFCCNGCKTVYQILSDNDLSDYYTLEKNPGSTPLSTTEDYYFLSNPKVVQKIVDFQEEHLEVVTLYIPKIHCSSCVWVLENLQKIHPSIINSRVHFSKKTVQITYQTEVTLLEVVNLLATIGYEPYISLENETKSEKKDNMALYKLAVAGFAFGNTMFLSFPDYFGGTDVWLQKYQPLFTLLMLVFSIPVVVYAGNEYLISAYKGLKKGILNIDVPISIGILVLFGRSTYEYLSATGQGYFDSLAGLIFFLLLGKYFQKKTYHFLSFERDFKSYFPIAVTVLVKDTKVVVPVNEIQKDDLLFIRNKEIVPTDGIVIKGTPLLDYSFVTGESRLIEKKSGDKIYAGGRHQGEAITIRVTKTVDQSYLTKLWSQNTYADASKLTQITDVISNYFTIGLLTVTLLSALCWWWVDSNQIINVVSSILIVACPCALALSAPFALGNVLRILGKKGFYIKDSHVVEHLAKIKTIFFDKTGTLTARNQQELSYVGTVLTDYELSLIKSLTQNSNHPLSRGLSDTINGELLKLDSFQELEGRGLQAEKEGVKIKIGSARFVLGTDEATQKESRVYVCIGRSKTGYFKFGSTYRKSIFKTLKSLQKKYKIHILSGDSNADQSYLEKHLATDTQYYFNQSPHNKLACIKKAQQQNENVMMVGDGLNDAGALMQAQVGIAVAENVNVFSPASDAIIDASQLVLLPKFMKFCEQSIHVVRISFVLSILYNIIGLYFAITGKLTPLIAAILMPLSSITIVTFVTLATNIWAKKLFKS